MLREKAKLVSLLALCLYCHCFASTIVALQTTPPFFVVAVFSERKKKKLIYEAHSIKYHICYGKLIL